MPGQIEHIPGGLDVLDHVEIFLRIPNLVGIAQQRPHQTLVDADGPSPASESRATSATRWYQFCICDIVSALRMSMHGVRTFTEPAFFTEDDMAKKAKKAKTAKAATKKVAKKTSKKKK